MNSIEQYRHQVINSRTRENVGYYKYKVRPISGHGERVFASYIKDRLENTQTIFNRLLNKFNNNEIESLLTEKKYELAGFNGNFEVAYFEVGPSAKTIARGRLMNNIVDSVSGISKYDIEVTLGDFIPHPRVEVLDYDDIQDLRFLKK